MASAAPYTITPEPLSSIQGSQYQPIQQSLPPTVSGPMPIYQTSNTAAPVQAYQSSGLPAGANLTNSLDTSIYQQQFGRYVNPPSSQPHQYTTASGYQAEAGSLSQAYRLNQSRMQSTTLGNDVATTTSKVAGVIPTGLFTSYVPTSHLNSRQQSAAGAKQPVTVYYTDDLYPPYYAKAKKIASTKKRTGCCA